MRTCSLVLVALCLSAMPIAARSQPLPHSIQHAKHLLTTGQLEEARTLLEALEREVPQDNDIEFLLGLVTTQTGEYARAIGLFHSVLVRQPAAMRVRLELARALYLDRQYESAFRQFQFARAGTRDEGIIANINRYLAAIRLRKNWSYSVSVAMAPDTNINSATSASEAVIFGLPFELDQKARRKSGIGLAVAGSLETAPLVAHRARLRIGGTVHRREYSGHTFDDTILGAHLGPRIIRPRWDLSVLATHSTRIYGGQVLNRGTGARVEAFHQLDGRTGLSLNASVQRLRYPRSEGQTGTNYAAWVALLRTLTPASSLSLRGAASHHAGRADAYSYNWAEASVGYYRDLTGGFSIYVEPGLSFTRYDGADPLFGRRRRDAGQEVQVAVLNRRFLLSRFTPRVAYSFARRHSNIELFEIRQHRLEAGLGSRF